MGYDYLVLGSRYGGKSVCTKSVGGYKTVPSLKLMCLFAYSLIRLCAYVKYKSRIGRCLYK